MLTERITGNAVPPAPALGLPKDFAVDLPGKVDFTWDRTSDSDGDVLTYRHCIWGANEPFTLDKCTPITVAFASPRSRLYALLLALLILLVLVILALTLMRRWRGVLLVVAILFLGAVVVAYFLVGRATTLTTTVAQLEPGQAYFWKVVAEDDQAALVESETRRLTVKP